ncbi:unnamed protein product [Caenorhabditis nigoni]
MNRMSKMEDLRDSQMRSDQDHLDSMKTRKYEFGGKSDKFCGKNFDEMKDNEKCGEKRQCMDDGNRCDKMDDEPMDKRRESDVRNKEM